MEEDISAAITPQDVEVATTIRKKASVIQRNQDEAVLEVAKVVNQIPGELHCNATVLSI